MSDTEQNDPYFTGSRRRKFSNWVLKNKEKYLEKLQRYRDNLENMSREDYKGIRENHADFNRETMDLLRNREAESYMTDDNFTDFNDDIPLGDLREERDREMNFERNALQTNRDSFNQNYNFDRDFNDHNSGNNQYHNQRGNYSGFNYNQEQRYPRSERYSGRNEGNYERRYRKDNDSYFHKKNMEDLQKKIDSLNMEIKYLKRKPARGEKFEAKTVYRCSENRDTSPAGLSLTHAAEAVDLLEEYLVSNQEDKRKMKENVIKQLSKIGKVQTLENKFNSSKYYNCDDFTPTFIDTSLRYYNVEKVSDKLKIIKNQLLSLKNVGLIDYIDQFHEFDFDGFSQYEFNAVFHNSLPRETKDRIECKNINPAKLTSKDYLNIVSDIVNNGRIANHNIDYELETFKTSKKNIEDIFDEYRRKINNLPPNIMTDSEKERRLHSQMLKYLPSQLLSILRIEEAKLGRNLNSKTLHDFILLNRDQINKYLRFVHKTTTAKKIPIKRVEENDLDEDNITEINYEIEEEYQTASSEEEDEDSNVLKVKNEPRPFKKCKICKKNYHTQDECIFIADDNKRQKNQQKLKIRNCLKCKGQHKDSNCEIFKKLVVPKPCERCEAAEKYEYHHTPEECLKVNFLDN